MSGLTWGSVIPLSPLICDHSVSLHSPFRPSTNCPRYIYSCIWRYSRFLPLLEFFIVKDQNLPYCFWAIRWVRPSSMLSSVTTCFNSSAHEFRGAGSSLATRPSKLESTLKLCCNISSGKTILSTKKLLVVIHAVHNDSTKTEKWVFGKHSYTFTEKLVHKNKYKKSNSRTHKQKTKKMQYLFPSGLAKISKYKKSSACHGGIRNNFSQFCEKRTHQVAFIVSALIRRRCDVLISWCLASWRKDRYRNSLMNNIIK